MPDHIPPPGAERDAEIMAALGYTYASRKATDPDPWIRDGVRFGGRSVSTDPAAADRLVEEMVRRGWRTTMFADQDGIRAAVGHYPGCRCLHPLVTGETRCDAVSAAALLALRSAS